MTEMLEPVGKWFKKHQAVAPFYVRLIMGFIFAIDGYAKVTNLGGIAKFFASLQIPLPGVAAPFIGYLEFLGGILLIMGVFTRYIGILLACDMITAISLTGLKRGFPGINLEFGLLGAALFVAFAGSGAWGFDEKWTGWFKKHHALGPFFLRLCVGIILGLEGLSKMLDLSGTAKYFGTIGIPIPGFAAGFVAAVELLAGLALIGGLLARYAAFLIAVDMLVAIFLVHAKNGLGQNGIMIPLLVAAGAITLMFAGPGKWGVEQSHV